MATHEWRATDLNSGASFIPLLMHRRKEELMGRVKQHKKQLSTKELMQLTIWGGLLLVILLGLVYGLVRAGAVIPVGSGVERRTVGAIHGNAPNSRR